MADAVAELAGRIHAAVAGRSGTRWVGVDGRGGAGKTTLVEQLRELLPDSMLVTVDDFARPGVTTWEHDRFLTQLVRPLQAGHPGRYQRWDWATDSGREWVEVPPGRVMIIEGVSSTDDRLGIGWDFTIWVDAPADERLRRVLERDGEAMRRTWLEEWFPSEEAYIAAQHPERRADVVVCAVGGEWTIVPVNHGSGA